MTDTGRVPGEGLPGPADAHPEAQLPHPTAASDGAYAYADPEAVQDGFGAEEEELLMPGAQSAWGDGQPVPGQGPAQHTQPAQGGHWAPAPTPPPTPRRPLHLGPPVPEQSGAVKTLADRGPSTPPAQPFPTHGAAAGPVAGSPDASPTAYVDHQQQAADARPGPLGSVPAQREEHEGEGWAAPAAPGPMDGAGHLGHAAPEPPPNPQAGAPLPGPDLAAVPTFDTPEQAAPVESARTHVPPHETAEQAAAMADTAARQDVAVEAASAPVPEAPQTTVEPQGPPQQPVAYAGNPDEEFAAAVAEGDAALSGQELPEAGGGMASDAPSAQPHEADTAASHAVPEGVADVTAAGDSVVASEPADVDVRPGSAEPEGAEPAPVPAVDEAAVVQAEPIAQTEPVLQPEPASQPEPPQPEPVAQAEAVAQAEPAAEAASAPGADPSETAPGDEAAPVDAAAQVDAPAADRTAPASEAGGTDAAPPEETDAPVAEAPAVLPEQPATQPPDVADQDVPEEQHDSAAQPEPGQDTADENDDATLAPAATEASSTEEGDDTGDAVQSPEDAPSADADREDASATPPAPGYDEAERETVHRLMRERRDVRNGFRPDAIPDDVLLRVLEAAHTAPSVGHSQPWDFVVIRSEETRRAMHELALRQRTAYAKSLPRARAKQFKELKVEAILDTPINIVVTADPTRGGRHTLGRHTQPQTAPYSSALAVENLWLAARAEGLGVGWVSFFDEQEMVRALDLPEHLEVVAYLCIGYVDEFPAEPELVQAGWSERRPLSWVVHEESYGRRVLPGAEPHDLLAETLERIRPLDAKALGEAWERQKRMTKPGGALGVLEIISAQLCGLSRKCPPPIPEPAAVAVFAGDHGVHAQGVTPWPQEVTAQMVGNFLGGGAVCNAFANQVGAEVCVVDVGVVAELPPGPGFLPRKVRAGTADMTQGPALTRDEVLKAVEVGIETARDLVAAGNKGLVTGEMGIANTTASAALIAACTGSDPTEVTGRGTGIDDETHHRKIDVVRRALELHQPDPDDPIGMLAAVGGLEHAALTGFILGGASLRTPVILDGVSAGAAALVARQIAPEALAACIAGHRSAEPGHVAALTKLGLRPLIDLDLRLGEGTGALLALPMVQSAARAMHEVATFDGAGITEKN